MKFSAHGWVLWTAVLPAVIQAAEHEDTAFFESKIRPMLVKHCYECHSNEAGQSKGGLLLDTRESIRAGGDTGPAILPGDPEGSLLLSAIKHSDPDLEMPPKEARLPEAVISDFTAWIKAGAADPRVSSGSKLAERPPVDVESARQFWSYKKPAPAAHPAVSRAEWPLRDMDAFILAKLDENKISPSPDAEPLVLLRRLHFDLIGLPPTPEEAELFVQKWRHAKSGSQSDREQLVESTVDRLLQSPHFGERWGRHWLDVARYAESNGRESNLAFPHAWRYRDYVIDAVNADVPFDRFITEQIAGDLLPSKDDAERARLLIATGFLALGPKGLNEMNKAQFAADVADEQLDAVSRAVMASSVACARCHDHKTDPFSMEDYYALAGIFKSSKTFYGNWIDSENNNDGDLIKLPDLPGQLVPNRPLPAERVQQLKEELVKLNREEYEQQQYALKAKMEGRDISGEFMKMLQTAIRIYWSRGGIEGQLETVDEKGRALPLCMGVMDAKKVADSQLYERGELAHPVKAIPRGFPKVIETGTPPVPQKQSGRLELAQWLTSRENPLTARVMANRVWRHLFGAGLVRTVDNFGFSGERPSHPELLDHLAIRFMDAGWSVKALIREVVLSRTYRQASTLRPEAFQQDPDNRLLWRATKRRLDAEVIRDSMLAVSGLLDSSRRQGSLIAELDGQSISLIAFNPKVPVDLDGSHRRSVYLPVIRDHLPDVLEHFDAANPNLVTGDRDVTNVPLQALYLLNGSFVHEQGTALAKRIRLKGADQTAQIHLAFQLCFNRSPDAREMALAEAFFRRVGGEEGAEEAMEAFCQSLLSSAEFRNAD